MKTVISLIRGFWPRFLPFLVAFSMWTGLAPPLCQADFPGAPVLAPGAPSGSADSFLDDFFEGLARESYDQDQLDKMLAKARARLSSMKAAAAELEPLLDYADPLRKLDEAEREEGKIRQSTEGAMKRLASLWTKTSALGALRREISEAAEKLYHAHQEIRTAMRRACRETPSPREGEAVAAQSKKAVAAYALVKAAADKAGRIKASVKGEIDDGSDLEAAARRAEEAIRRVAEASDRVDEVFGGDAGPWLERIRPSCDSFLLLLHDMGLSHVDWRFLGGPRVSASPESPDDEVERLYNETFSIAKRVVGHGNYHFLCGGGTDSDIPLPGLRNRASAKIEIRFRLAQYIELRKTASGIGEIGSIFGDIESTSEAAALAFQASRYEAAEAALCASRKKALPDAAKDSSAEKAAGPRLRWDEAYLEKEWRRMLKEGTLDEGAGWWPGEDSAPSGECLTLQREYAAGVRGADLVSARAVLDRAAKASCGWRARAESNFIGNALREREAGAQRKERCRKAYDGYKRAVSEKADLEVILKFLEPSAECEWGMWVAATKAKIQEFLASRAKAPPAAGAGPKNEKGFWDYFWGGVADGVNAGGKIIMDAMNQDFQRRLIQQRNARPAGTKGPSAAQQARPPAQAGGGSSRPVESSPLSECRRMDEMIYQAARSNNLESVSGLGGRWEALGCTFSPRTDAALDAAVAGGVQRSTQPLRDTLQRMKNMKP